MTDIILHNCDLSPFSEKIRLALGFKGLPWRSARIDVVQPDPCLYPGGESLAKSQSHGWMARIAEIGHGEVSEMTPDAALAMAGSATPADAALLADGDFSGIAAGTVVTVTPNDNARAGFEVLPVLTGSRSAA